MKNNILKSKSRPKVFVGLSGGVDSAVSAALLKKDGYDVTGVFIKAWSPEGYPCTWKEDRRSAMRVAAVLDIPFITLDLSNEYKNEVVDYMIREYKEGRTPNPDVMCNKEIKFGRFLRFALDNGADYVATGHYAQTGEMRLMEGADKNKDQSYFLWALTEEQLKHVLFPVGHFQKNEVRELAERFKLPQATRKDSQGVCFLGQINMKEFLKEFVGAARGDILNESGEIIGEHEGAILYTIGERHGFSVANKNTYNEPLYVISKNIEENTITVAPNFSFLPHPVSRRGSLTAGERSEVKLKDTNWISGKIPDLSKKYSCRIRYRQEKQGCKIQLRQTGNVEIIFNKPQTGISSGQSLVLYDNDICLGGGIMEI